MKKEVTLYPLLEEREENRNLLIKNDKCDKCDYLAAVACGVIGGLIDIFFVGMPKASQLVGWSDEQVDKAVKTFARKLGWNSQQRNSDNVNSAIGFLERRFKVNYDQRKPGDVNNLFEIAPKTHHMMSLAHSPDIVGLFFSVLNQFTSTSSFISNGQLITVSTDTYELKGNDFITKIFCGIANWFTHLMSDVAGSSGSHGRGIGIVIPFYEFFGFCKIGSFNTENGAKDLAELAMQAYIQGYDCRFGITQAVPVIVTEFSIRLIWALKQKFQYQVPVRECIPDIKKNKLRVMLILGNGTLCFMDGVDAGIRSGGDMLLLFMRLNLVSWFRFTTLVLKDIFIRIGLNNTLQTEIEAFKRINLAMELYLQELKKIDIYRFKKEIEVYNIFQKTFCQIKSEKELTELLNDMYENLKIEKPWSGDFDEHMSNKNGALIFHVRENSKFLD